MLMRHVPFLLSTAALAALAGCPDREVSELNPQQGKVEFKDIPVTVNRDLDLLFVIDNSGSMKEEQDSLTANFPRFIEVLNGIEGGLPNVHIAVVTSDMGSLGGPQTGQCRNNGEDGVMRELVQGSNIRYISDLKDDATQMRVRNYAGSLSSVFTSIASVGTQGCGFESHLGAMRRALENPANAGFLRPNAYLGVIFIADEDDCSLKAGQGQAFFGQSDIGDVQSYGCFRSSTACDGNLGDAPGPRANCRSNENSVTHEKIQTFVDALKAVKTDPNLLVVAGIVGDPAPVGVLQVTRNGKTVPDVVPSCTYQRSPSDPLQRAFPAVRTNQFLKSFPNSTTTTICKGDLTDGLVQIATLLKSVIGSPCIDSDLADPIQCSVVDVTNQGKANETRTVLGQCDASASVKPCWRLTQDLQKCANTRTKLALTVERNGTASPDTHVLVNCVTK
jgi:hypothetical protein